MSKNPFNTLKHTKHYMSKILENNWQRWTVYETDNAAWWDDTKVERERVSYCISLKIFQEKYQIQNTVSTECVSITFAPS